MFSLKEKTKEHLGLDLDPKIIRIIDKLLNYAISAEAAEIFFEPREDDLAVIFRIASGIENVLRVPKKTESALIYGLKEMAGISDSLRNTSDSGKFKKDYQGFKVIFSLAVHPTTAGEKITIDLQKEKFELLEIGRLGFNAPALAAVKKNLNKKNGLTLVVGNFNSGRTATLYSFLNFINKPDLNIATVESDIALDIPQINQSLLDPISGFSSAVALNSLRHRDADVIMIADINDQETTELAMQLAESGRFVLGGLYSQNAATALTFFRDLEIPLSSFNSAVKMVVTERLLRKICPHCLTEQKISATTRQALQKKFDLDKLLKKMRADKVLPAKVSGAEDLVFYKGRGCSYCGETGFLGKAGIFEVLEITPEVKKIIKEGHFSRIQEEVRRQGGYLLEEDALIKVLGGSVEIEEVFRMLG